MTILGIDVSHWNPLSKKPVNVRDQGYDFIIWKATQGANFRDPTFKETLDHRYGGPLYAAYHFLDSSSAEAQYRNISRTVPKSVPVIVDMEQGNLITCQRLIMTLRDNDYTSPLIYLPQWYWEQIGRPNISHLPPLWSSKWVSGTGYGAALFRHTTSRMWAGYGGLGVAMLQFTDKGRLDAVDGPLDLNAFAGTVDDLRHLFNTPVLPGPMPDPQFWYVVIAGDTLWEIAFKTLRDSNRWREIATANHLANPNHLIPGQRLLIPGWDGIYHSVTDAIRYTVVGGDTLSGIAKRFGVSVGALYDANRGTIGGDPDHIRVGMVLSIPKIR